MKYFSKCKLFLVLLGSLVCFSGSDSLACSNMESGTKTENTEKKEKKPICLKGHLSKDKRSISVDCPVSAYWDGEYLYIENRDLSSDINLTLSKNGQVVCEEVIPAGSSQVVIYVGKLSVEEICHLKLTNQWGDCWVGEFEMME